MTMRAIQELIMKAQEAQRKKYPLVPVHALPKPKFTDQTTNGLTLAILECFKLHGFFATRIDSKGTFNQALKRFIPSNQKKGLPDVFAQAPGLPPLWIEVKCAATKDRLKPHQIETIALLRNSGALVYIATEFESFYEWFKAEVINSNTSKLT